MSPRAPRSDAVRNRARILTAAGDAFARHGSDVPLDTIAELAGVGAGTVHRHFPTKESLLDAVLGARLGSLADRANELAGQPSTDFFAFLAELTDAARGNLVLASALGSALSPEASRAAARLTHALAQLLAAAQRAGHVRPDLTVEDLHAAIAGAVTIEQRLPQDRHGLGLSIVLAGLQAVPDPK
jgi:AcrR family transcriptional regulator